VRGQSALRIVLATLSVVTILLAVCVVTASYFNRAFSPPNAKMLTERLTRDGTLALLQQTGQRILAGEAVPPADRQRLLKSGVHSIERVPYGKPATTGVTFEFGGADNHYGLLITADPASAPNIGYTLKPLQQNLWYYSEVRPQR
jgi:hypothetical protein